MFIPANFKSIILFLMILMVTACAADVETKRTQLPFIDDNSDKKSELNMKKPDNSVSGVGVTNK